MTNDEFKIWAAGIFEGEGCVFVEKKRASLKGGRKTDYFSYGLRVDVANTDIAILDALNNKFGGSVQVLKRQNVEYKICYHWRLCGLNAAKFLRQIRPFIVGNKGRQADLAIQFADKYSGNENRIGYGGRSKEDKENQDYIYTKLRTIKNEGERWSSLVH